ncbi:MAG TPA: hypothetical protein VMU73_12255, partial [Gaiellaceae bacterium]|nr:hypothetical protein [Gaiellaceae bacterium]
IAGVLRTLFEHYVDRPEQLPPADGGHEDDDLARRVTDYLAGMTDRYCINAYTDLEVPKAFAL